MEFVKPTAKKLMIKVNYEFFVYTDQASLGETVCRCVNEHEEVLFDFIVVGSFSPSDC